MQGEMERPGEVSEPEIKIQSGAFGEIPERDKRGRQRLRRSGRWKETAEEEGRKARLIEGKDGGKGKSLRLERQHELVSRKEEAGKNEDEGLKGLESAGDLTLWRERAQSFEKMMWVGLASGSEEPGAGEDRRGGCRGTFGLGSSQCFLPWIQCPPPPSLKTWLLPTHSSGAGWS